MPKADLSGKDLITTQDWSIEELDATLKMARKLKADYHRGRVPHLLSDKTFFMLFYAPSTRTRAAFEAGMTYLGGHAQYIDVSTTRLGSGEAAKDVAKMYEKYGHGLGVRILDSAIDYVYGAGISVVREYCGALRNSCHKHGLLHIPPYPRPGRPDDDSRSLGESEGEEVRDNVGVL